MLDDSAIYFIIDKSIVPRNIYRQRQNSFSEAPFHYMNNHFYIVVLLFFDLWMNFMLKIGWMIYYGRQYFLWRHMPSYQFKNLIILKPFKDSFLRKLTDVTQIFKAQLRTECSKRVWILRFSAFFQNKRDSKCCWVHRL